MLSAILILLNAFVSPVSAAAINMQNLLQSSCEKLVAEYGSGAVTDSLIHAGIKIDEADCLKLKVKIQMEEETQIEFTLESDRFVCELMVEREQVNVLERSTSQPMCKNKADPFIETFKFKRSSHNVRQLSSDEVRKVFLKNPPSLSQLTNVQSDVRSYSDLYEVKNSSQLLVGYVQVLSFYNLDDDFGREHILKYNSEGWLLGHLFNEKEGREFADFCEYLAGNLDNTEDAQAWDENRCEGSLIDEP